MGSIKKGEILLVLVFGIMFCISCKTEINENVSNAGRMPHIEPDYSDVTIPANIAPMNFFISEEGRSYIVIATSEKSGLQITLNTRDGIVRFPERKWKKLTSRSAGDEIKIRVYASEKGKDELIGYEPFSFFVATELIDPYLVYRLIHPGYYSWSEIKIVQRSLESFKEESIIENQVMENNCANCHSFNSNNAERFMVHIRGSLGGTYFVEDRTITRTDPKINAMPGGATYPSWHPGGRFLAFSSNQVRQSFYSETGKHIEVYDLVSSLIMYDRTNSEIINITDSDTAKYLQTFPSWSPDGKYLYFCRAPQYKSGYNPDLEEIKATYYDIARKSFDPVARSFGETEIVFRASEINKSASFPRISPDGRFLVFTLADYGTFPVWHREADLYSLNLNTGIAGKMDLNSGETESYHTWSVNGRWLVFSSRRIDGRSGRPYFAYIGPEGKEGKPFVLPQKDPTLYNRLLESFNIPEFVNGRIRVNPRDFERASRQNALAAHPGNPLDTLRPEIKLKENERSIHE